MQQRSTRPFAAPGQRQGSPGEARQVSWCCGPLIPIDTTFITSQLGPVLDSHQPFLLSNRLRPARSHHHLALLSFLLFRSIWSCFFNCFFLSYYRHFSLTPSLAPILARSYVDPPQYFELPKLGTITHKRKDTSFFFDHGEAKLLPGQESSTASDAVQEPAATFRSALGRCPRAFSCAAQLDADTEEEEVQVEAECHHFLQVRRCRRQ